MAKTKVKKTGNKGPSGTSADVIIIRGGRRVVAEPGPSIFDVAEQDAQKPKKGGS